MGEMASSLGIMVAAFKGSKVYRDCEAIVNSFSIFGKKEIEIEGDTDCRFPYGSPKWNTDPCCNDALRLKQCCLPKRQTVEIETMTSVDSDMVDLVCDARYKDNVQILMDDVIASK